MGGRGGASGLNRQNTTTFKFDVSSLSGSEKQKAWAQNIVDDALNTINANIKNLSAGNARSQLSDSKELVEIYTNFGNQIKGQLEKFTKASEVIDYRSNITGERIIRMANGWLLQRKNKRRRV